jgi:hypothetical protein
LAKRWIPRFGCRAAAFDDLFLNFGQKFQAVHHPKLKQVIAQAK